MPTYPQSYQVHLGFLGGPDSSGNKIWGYVDRSEGAEETVRARGSRQSQGSAPGGSKSKMPVLVLVYEVFGSWVLMGAFRFLDARAPLLP